VLDVEDQLRRYAAALEAELLRELDSHPTTASNTGVAFPLGDQVVISTRRRWRRVLAGAAAIGIAVAIAIAVVRSEGRPARVRVAPGDTTSLVPSETRRWIIPIGAPDDTDPPNRSGTNDPAPTFRTPVDDGPLATRLAAVLEPVVPAGAQLTRVQDYEQADGRTVAGSVSYTLADGTTLQATAQRLEAAERLQFLILGGPEGNSALSRLPSGTEVVSLERRTYRLVHVVRPSGVSLTLSASSRFAEGLVFHAPGMTLEELLGLATQLDTPALDHVFS
jgi:hypothetical protein